MSELEEMVKQLFKISTTHLEGIIEKPKSLKREAKRIHNLHLQQHD